jgi:16S rRNA (cytosine967-C5)-methyltransferase
LPEENGEQVESFLAAEPGFRLAPPADVLAASPVDPSLGNASRDLGSGLLLTPHRTGTDGFFIAVMTRASSS